MAIDLECKLNFHPGEQWTKCTWSHTFTDVYTSNGDQAYIMCSAGDTDDHETTCTDQGNLAGQNQGWSNEDITWVEDYSNRLSFIVDQHSCGLKIDAPHANDTGEWKCHVDDNNPFQPAVMWSSVKIFVANQSEVAISDPDLDEDPDAALEVDLSSGRPEIKAACTSSYGIPRPTIKWYIDNPDQQIRDRDLDDVDEEFDEDENTVTSSVTIRLDESKLSNWGIDANQPFAFALGCNPDQGNYFKEENRRDNRYSRGREAAPSRNYAEVMVYGTSGGGRRAVGAIVVVFVAVIGTLFWN